MCCEQEQSFRVIGLSPPVCISDPSARKCAVHRTAREFSKLLVSDSLAQNLCVRNLLKCASCMRPMQQKGTGHCVQFCHPDSLRAPSYAREMHLCIESLCCVRVRARLRASVCMSPRGSNHTIVPFSRDLLKTAPCSTFYYVLLTIEEYMGTQVQT
jgi:hypothetical protein